MAVRTGCWRSAAKLEFPILRRGLDFLKRSLNPSGSADYKAWRQQFLRDRLRLALWIGIPCFLTLTAHQIYLIVFDAAQLTQDINKFYGDPTLADRFITTSIASSVATGLLLVLCVLLQRMQWIRRQPVILFFGISWSFTLSDMIVGTFFGVPRFPDAITFLAQAILIPVHWQLHLASQLGSLFYFIVVYPALGLTKIGDRSIYDSYAIGSLVNLLWMFVICDLSVYLYERLKRSEFETQRQLRVFLHSVSHDLKTPVMGTSIVLQSLLKKPDSTITIERSVLEQLLEGSERQLTLIDSLLEAHSGEIDTSNLNCEPLQLGRVVNYVLDDLEPALRRNQIAVANRVDAQLPLVYGDANQLWRVYCNLITNALKHNPHGIDLTIDAEVTATVAERKQTRPPTVGLRSGEQQRWLYCTVADSGIGIDAVQSRRLFDLYTRGRRARYMPGLGLGLYLCRQIVTAHGGEIGVISRPGKGSTFWFTLPIV